MAATKLSTLVAGAVTTAARATARAARRGRDLMDRGDRTMRRRLAARSRYVAGRVEGLAYRLEGRRPDPEVDDTILTQRVRSSLGPLERRLDLPHVHITVADHVARLHGVVARDADARRLERAAARVSGVRAVDSYLHRGLGPGDTRPSSGRRVTAPSAARKELFGAVRQVGVDEPEDVERLVRGILSNLLDLLPDGERGHVLAHLPDDVRTLATPPRRLGAVPKPRTIASFVAAVADACGVLPDTADQATRSLIASLRALVPEEVDDVAAVLPSGLKELWQHPLVALEPSPAGSG